MRHLSCSLMVIGWVVLGMGFSVRSMRAAEKEMEGKIVVMPFTALNESEPQAWVGKSIQQSLLADLTPYAPARVQSSDVQAKDAGAALDAARKEGARYVVIGNFATVGGDLRVTGQVLDVSSGKPLAAMKATGLTRELFSLEDALGSQVRRGLGMSEVAVQPAAPDADVQAAAPPVQAPAQFESGDFSDGPYAGNSGYADTGAYGDTGYGWGLGPWIGGFGFGRQSHFRHHLNASTNATWNGSYALGLANSVNGVPLGPQNTPSIAATGFYPYGSPVYSGANLANSSRLGTVSPQRRTAAASAHVGSSRAAPSRSASAPRH